MQEFATNTEHQGGNWGSIVKAEIDPTGWEVAYLTGQKAASMAHVNRHGRWNDWDWRVRIAAKTPVPTPRAGACFFFPLGRI